KKKQSAIRVKIARTWKAPIGSIRPTITIGYNHRSNYTFVKFRFGINLNEEFNFLCCANYETILRGLSHPKFCIGMGQNFSDNFVEISCVSNGTVAEKLYENWFSSTAKVVVCVLKLWRIEWREGCLSYITNFEECLDILFDPQIPDIVYFKSM
ncbi:hypothetical protein HID58_087076, partial [Brassica napus]